MRRSPLPVTAARPARAAPPQAMESMQFSPHMPAEVYACTVGQKPSKAPFYVNDPADVLATLNKLTEAAPAPAPAHSPSVSFA